MTKVLFQKLAVAQIVYNCSTCEEALSYVAVFTRKG
jgi:hypothetical protein